ncbi:MULTISPECIES: PadR family transcriptional regulator [Enterococcus]|uniref:PadR family transcriptional regulator n=1 Tax=Enterococcus alishanensis TaxID=1303817 RepID=A0ABS6T9E5_9ENTE|nr:PadR family transcriptional regulator [Enterococcus alishanensis]MBV7389532.1 PadR family transcriptional regulator [Enterococcus alishanensis]
MDEALTDSNYLILLALLRPQHGYAIMKEVSALTEGNFEIGPASMYTILKKLTKSGYITLEESTDRKKIYQITDSGKEVLRKDVRRRKLFYQFGERLLSDAGGEG